MTDLDVLALDELDQEPLYRDFWRPQGFGWMVGTIGTHVRGVLEKTGCNRQTDVVALLTAISPARLPHPV